MSVQFSVGNQKCPDSYEKGANRNQVAPYL